MFDIAGVLLLVIAVFLFAFLTKRLGKLKNGILKWGGVFLSGLLAFISAILLVLALVGFFKLNVRHNISASPPITLRAAIMQSMVYSQLRLRWVYS